MIKTEMLRSNNTTQHNRKMYRFGLLLSLLYLGTSFIADCSLLPDIIPRVLLYSFLAYGLLITFIETRDYGLIIAPYSIWYFLFLIAAFFTVFYSPNISFLSSNFYATIICFLITFFMSKFINDQDAFSLFCWGNVCISGIMVLLLYFTGNLQGSESERLGQDLTGNANVFGAGIMYPCVYAIWLLMFEAKDKKKRIFLITVIILDMYAIVLSAGRKVFIGPFIFLYILFLFKQDKTGRKHAIWYSLVVVLFISVIVVVVYRIPLLYESIGIRMEQMINNITNNGVVDQSTLIRKDLRQFALSEWLKSPIIGHGFDSFKYISGRQLGLSCYSHCNQTELLCNGGLIVTCLYYGLFVKVIWDLRKRLQIASKYICFSMAAIIMEFLLDIGFVSYNLLNVQLLLMLAVLASSFDEKKRQESDNNQRYRYIKR